MLSTILNKTLSRETSNQYACSVARSRVAWIQILCLALFIGATSSALSQGNNIYTNLEAQAWSTTGVELDWSATPSTQTMPGTVTLFRSTSPTGPWTVVMSRVEYMPPEYEDTSITTPGLYYYYLNQVAGSYSVNTVVVSVDTRVARLPEPTVKVIPSGPGILPATLTVYWSSVPGASSYNTYSNTSVTSAPFLLWTIDNLGSGTSTNSQVIGSDPGGIFSNAEQNGDSYRVGAAAVASTGAGVSNLVIGTPGATTSQLPPAPTNFTATYETNGSVMLVWVGSQVVNVYRLAGIVTNPSVTTLSPTYNVTSPSAIGVGRSQGWTISDPSVPAGTYTYVLAGVNNYGEGSIYAVYTVTVP